jgi:hypothetical protein
MGHKLKIKCVFKGECAQLSFNLCPIYTHDGASAKFSTNSEETDNSVGGGHILKTFWHEKGGGEEAGHRTGAPHLLLFGTSSTDSSFQC